MQQLSEGPSCKTILHIMGNIYIYIYIYIWRLLYTRKYKEKIFLPRYSATVLKSLFFYCYVVRYTRLYKLRILVVISFRSVRWSVTKHISSIVIITYLRNVSCNYNFMNCVRQYILRWVNYLAVDFYGSLKFGRLVHNELKLNKCGSPKSS